MPRIHVKLGIFTLTWILCVCSQVFGQVPTPTAEEFAEVRRKEELLRHPTFVSLRLASAPRDVPQDAPSDTPALYKVKDYIAFELFRTQNSSEAFTIWTQASPCFRCRPKLTKDGEVIPYSERVQKGIESQQPENEFRGSGAPITYEPGREYGPERINLSDWYEPLEPGRYQLIVRKRFAWDGDWVLSNPVYFEVVPRPLPRPIPESVSIELVPEGLQTRKDGTYEATTDLAVVFFVVNNADQPVKRNVIDREYGNQPQLFRDGALIPYREEMVRRIRAKEENPRLIEITNDVFLEPKMRSWGHGISLKDWYGPLAPGSYRLVNRQRFEIDGPWTAESAPLLFEVVASKGSPR